MDYCDGLAQVLSDVTQERCRQQVKWGDQSNHPGFTWTAILGEEFGESCEAALNCAFPGAHREVDPAIELRRELVQVAAVAVAWIQALDARGFIQTPASPPPCAPQLRRAPEAREGSEVSRG